MLRTDYQDNDNDGYGDPIKTTSASSQPSGYVSNNTDCNDYDDTIHPGAAEIKGDGIDQDCDGKDLIDPDELNTYYQDNDNDGYGDPGKTTSASSQPSGYVSNNTDCNDYDDTIHPGATEIKGDGIDQDCNGKDLTDTHNRHLNQTQVSQLYVSIFGRASEGEGNTYWQVQPDMATAASAMLDTQAAKNYFGSSLDTDQAFIEHIYKNTLNKTLQQDSEGIFYWTAQLGNGVSRGQVIASMIEAVKYYAPSSPYYNDDDGNGGGREGGMGQPSNEHQATLAAYYRFQNRVTVSNYMADTVWTSPSDWVTSTAFSASGLNVTDKTATIITAKVLIDSFQTNDTFQTNVCGAYVTPDVWKEFDCYNLAAIGKTTYDDPFTPSWRLIGGYWQWGRKGPDPSQWYDTNAPNFAHGPTGQGLEDANIDSVSNWDEHYAPDGAWSDSYKTANDPCPAGFRVPTRAQWQGVIDNNAQNIVGTWDRDGINYSSARFFGNALMLPGAGVRNYDSGKLSFHGDLGFYSSSSKGSSNDAWDLNFDSGYAGTSPNDRRNGLSIRCVAE